MIQAIMRKRHEQEGFTLVELLIVIVILAILAAIVVFAVGGITNNGQAAACKQDAKTLQTAEEAFFAQNSSYTAQASLSPTYIHQLSSWYDVSVPAGNKSYSLTLTAAGTTAGCTANP